MNAFHLTSLLREFGAYVQLADTSQLLQERRLTVNGIDLHLIYDEDIDPAALWLQLNLGPLPSANREIVLKAILSSNYTFNLAGQGGFCMEPASETILLVIQLTIDQHVTPASFATALGEAAMQGKHLWDELLRAAM